MAVLLAVKAAAKAVVVTTAMDLDVETTKVARAMDVEAMEEAAEDEVGMVAMIRLPTSTLRQTYA